MTRNQFIYVVGIQEEIESGLRRWLSKITDYKNYYYQGNLENALNTDFYGCVAKTREFDENLYDRRQDYRSVIDEQGLLACTSIIQSGTFYLDSGEELEGLEIEAISNAPWNAIEYPQIETRKGAATSLLEELVKESQSLGFGGILKAITVPRVREFYRKIGFIDESGGGSMILRPDAAEEFLIKQEEFRRESNGS